jgi:hypothetical protein
MHQGSPVSSANVRKGRAELMPNLLTQGPKNTGKSMLPLPLWWGPRVDQCRFITLLFHSPKVVIFTENAGEKKKSYTPFPPCNMILWKAGGLATSSGVVFVATDLYGGYNQHSLGLSP